MTSYSRGETSVVRNGELFTVVVKADEDTARDLRGMIAASIEIVGETLPPERRQRLTDMHAALGAALGEPFRTLVPRRRGGQVHQQHS